MKIQMTRREFMEAAEKALASCRAGSTGAAAVAAAREAGLEFAPEQEPLPERFYFLEMMSFPGDMPPIKGAVTDCEAGGLLLFVASDGGSGHHREQYRLDATRLACERANAYPALHAAAADLCRRVKGQCAANDRPPLPPLRHALDALEAELAKGPK